MIFKVITQNICHTLNPSGIIDILRSKEPDILFLQEVPHTSSELCDIVSHASHVPYFAHTSLADGNKPGVGVIHKQSLHVSDVHALEPGRILEVKVANQVFINIYAPAGSAQKSERRQLFNETLLRNLQHRHVPPVICGDFNCVIDPIDTQGNFANKKCDPLKQLVELFSYSDAYRVAHPNGSEFTFFRRGAAASRLDRFYLPPQLLPTFVSFAHIGSLSDHMGCELQLELQLNPAPPPTRDQGYWKLNSQVLRDPDFLDNFSDLWVELAPLQDNYPSASTWWEECAKPEIIKFLKQFSRVRSLTRKNTKRFLFAGIEAALQSGDHDQASLLRSRVKAMILEDAQGLVIRSREKESAEEERATLYHAARELKRGPTTCLSKLMVEGVEEEDEQVIQDEVVNYFTRLYNGQHRSRPGGGPPVDTGQPFRPDLSLLPEFLEDVGRLEDEEAAALEAPISLAELEAALEACEPNKSPGMDGLTYEFYKKVRPIIGPKLVEVFNSQLASDLLGRSEREAITRLIPKVQGTPSVTDLRPITLLCTDYKLKSRILSCRLNAVLVQILKSAQLCGRNHKNILFGATDFLSTIDYCSTRNIPAYLVSFDIYKAYDKANLSYLVKVMEHMNFSPLFIKWVKLFHNEVSTRFLLSSTTRPVVLRDNLRQGDNWAMPLYLLHMEPLLVQLGKAVRGARVGRVDQGVEAYVDDTSFISSDLGDLTRADDLFTRFEALSGTVLHRTGKCKVMGISGWQGKEDWPLPWLETVNEVKVFGITFCPTVKQTVKKTWASCIQGMGRCLQSWSSRSLPHMSQRAFLTKVFATSKLWYVGQVLPLPPSFARELERKVSTFMWLGRLERLETEELYSPSEQGGLALPNIQAKCSALLLKQLLRILETDTATRDHLLYWVGLRVRAQFPDLLLPVNSEIVTPYFSECVAVLQDSSLEPNLCARNAKSFTAKSIYKCLSSTPPPPKVENNYARDWQVVWANLDLPVISNEAKDIAFLVLHNIYPNKQRLNRIKNVHPTGFCNICPLETEDNIHLFANCPNVADCFNFAKQILVANKVLGVLEAFHPHPYNQRTLDDKILHMEIHSDNRNSRNVYANVISLYLLYVHCCKKSNRTISARQFRPYLEENSPGRVNLLFPT